MWWRKLLFISVYFYDQNHILRINVIYEGSSNEHIIKKSIRALYTGSARALRNIKSYLSPVPYNKAPIDVGHFLRCESSPFITSTNFWCYVVFFFMLLELMMTNSMMMWLSCDVSAVSGLPKINSKYIRNNSFLNAC